MDMEQYVKKNKLHRLEPYSSTLRRFLDHMRQGKPVPDVMMSRETMQQIDQEVETHLAQRLFSHPTFNFADLALNIMAQGQHVGSMIQGQPKKPPDSVDYDRNPIVVAVFMGRVAMIRCLNDELVKRQASNWDGIDAALKSYREALASVTAYAHRTPLHNAALRFGQDSDMFKEVHRGEKLANRGSDHRM